MIHTHSVHLLYIRLNCLYIILLYKNGITSVIYCFFLCWNKCYICNCQLQLIMCFWFFFCFALGCLLKLIGMLYLENTPPAAPTINTHTLGQTLLLGPCGVFITAAYSCCCPDRLL